jgi:hypothetical protein
VAVIVSPLKTCVWIPLMVRCTWYNNLSVTCGRSVVFSGIPQMKKICQFMVFNATFNNISVISWWSVLLTKETGENHWPAASHWQTLSHNVVAWSFRWSYSSSSTRLYRTKTFWSGQNRTKREHIGTIQQFQ